MNSEFHVGGDAFDGFFIGLDSIILVNIGESVDDGLGKFIGGY